MCGLVAIFNNFEIPVSYIKEKIEKVCKKDVVDYKTVIPKIDVGYSLNINMSHYIGIDEIKLFCDGDIYNAKELFEIIDVKPVTSMNSEIIIHLYIKYGIEYTLQVINGIFSFVLVDSRISQEKSRVYIARDSFGIVPLYALESPKKNVFGFSRNPQILEDISLYVPEPLIFKFLSGSYSVFEFPNKVLASWKCIKKNVLYHTVSNSSLVSYKEENPTVMTRIADEIQFWLNQSIDKRLSRNVDTSVACMLSGGFSSALIAARLVEKFEEPTSVETYSVGVEGSDELKCAKKIAEHLGTKHTEIYINKTNIFFVDEELQESCDYVMNSIGLKDINSDRKCMVKCILNKYISENSNSRIVFSGDGLNEMICKDKCLDATNAFDYDNTCRNEIRCNNHFCIPEISASYYELKTMLPFLDSELVDKYMSLPIILRYKYRLSQNIFQLSFSKEYWKNADVFQYCFYDNQ